MMILFDLCQILFTKMIWKTADMEVDTNLHLLCQKKERNFCWKEGRKVMDVLQPLIGCAHVASDVWLVVLFGCVTWGMEGKVGWWGEVVYPPSLVMSIVQTHSCRYMNMPLHTWPQNPFPHNTSLKWPNCLSEVFILRLLLLFFKPTSFLPQLLLIPPFLCLSIIAPSLYSQPNHSYPPFTPLPLVSYPSSVVTLPVLQNSLFRVLHLS